MPPAVIAHAGMISIDTEDAEILTLWASVRSSCAAKPLLDLYKTSGNTNDDLKWLATRIRQCRAIDFRALCGIFNMVIADLLQHYQVKHPLNKFELIAKIQTVADGSAKGGLHRRSDSL
ncbi:hypothetical protein DL98DRAFT_659970 [Cadophora sp. DSE1049]|nr:hypothetical protein DL98DRAFT_659970 [Cadophora sp. DSE1049]